MCSPAAELLVACGSGSTPPQAPGLPAGPQRRAQGTPPRSTRWGCVWQHNWIEINQSRISRFGADRGVYPSRLLGLMAEAAVGPNQRIRRDAARRSNQAMLGRNAWTYSHFR